MSTPTIMGNDAVLWGSGSFYGSGLIARGSIKLVTDKKEVRDNNGYVVTVIYYNQRQEATCDVIVETAAPTLDIGDDVTIAGTAHFLVEDTSQAWEQENVRMFSFSAVLYTGMTLT